MSWSLKYMGTFSRFSRNVMTGHGEAIRMQEIRAEQLFMSG